MKNRPLEYLSSVFWWNLQPSPTPPHAPVTPLLLLWLLLAVSGDLSGAGRAVCASPVSRYSPHCQTNNVAAPKYQRHFLSERHGHFSTPNFPGPFPLPFSGSWIINATGYEPDSYITLYLTQMYLTRGVQVSPISLIICLDAGIIDPPMDGATRGGSVSKSSDEILSFFDS
jgi:hypothetical protein